MASEIFDKTPTVEEALREFSRIKTIVTDAVEEGVESALRTIKQGTNAAEDMIQDTRRTVRQNPFQSLGIVFAVGVLAGGILSWIGSRRR
jgi:ElaB/YqjD/DUF883 family membrane-anchored ribosome-binding protein